MQWTFKPSQTAAFVTAAVFIFYWIICFGSELRPLIRLIFLSSSMNVMNELELQTAALEANHFISPNRAKSFDNATKIPLILHRMWRDNKVPDQWSTAYQNCDQFYKQKNWTTILWTDDSIRSFLTKHYEYFLPIFDSYPYDIQRVDAARYFVLFHYGGVYLDLDVGCKRTRDLTDLVRAMEARKAESMFPLTDPIGVSNDVIFASKRNTFFKHLIRALPAKNKWFGLPYFTVLFSTGPMFLTLASTNYARAKEEVLALSPVLYSKSDARFFRHLRGSTWYSHDANAIKWLAKNMLVVKVVVIIVVLLLRKGRIHGRQRRDSKPHRLSVQRLFITLISTHLY